MRLTTGACFGMKPGSQPCQGRAASAVPGPGRCRGAVAGALKVRRGKGRVGERHRSATTDKFVTRSFGSRVLLQGCARSTATLAASAGPDLLPPTYRRSGPLGCARCENISGEFVVAGRNSPKVLNFIEEALDDVALAVKCEIAIAFGLSVAFGGNYARDFSLRKAIDERISVVGLVRDQGFRIGISIRSWAQAKSWICPCREHQIGRIAQGIDEGVNFRCQPAT
jgi:hypothetical protein